MKFILPLRINYTTRKMLSLNLNQYRNCHFRALAQAKRNFDQWFYLEYGYNKKDPIKKCIIAYKIFFPNKRKVDVANVGSIVDKFTCDCLEKYKYILGDDRSVLKEIRYIDGGIDRNNPRAECKVVEIKHK